MLKIDIFYIYYNIKIVLFVMQDLIIHEVIYHMPIIDQIKLATLCKGVKLNKECIFLLNQHFKYHFDPIDNLILNHIKKGRIVGKLISYSIEGETTYYWTTDGLYSDYYGNITKHKYVGDILSLNSFDNTTFIICKHGNKRYIQYIGHKIGTAIYKNNFTTINVKNPLIVIQNKKVCVIASIYGIHVYVDDKFPYYIQIKDIIDLALHQQDDTSSDIIVTTPNKIYKFKYTDKADFLVPI